MPVGRGLRKVTEPQGFSYYLALIVDGIQMEKSRARARPNVVQNVYRRDHRDHRDPPDREEVFLGCNEGCQLLFLSISRTYKQPETLTVSGFVVVQALLLILRVNILSLGDPV